MTTLIAKNTGGRPPHPRDVIGLGEQKAVIQDMIAHWKRKRTQAKQFDKIDLNDAASLVPRKSDCPVTQVIKMLGRNVLEMPAGDDKVKMLFKLADMIVKYEQAQQAAHSEQVKLAQASLRRRGQSAGDEDIKPMMTAEELYQELKDAGKSEDEIASIMGDLYPRVAEQSDDEGEE